MAGWGLGRAAAEEPQGRERAAGAASGGPVGRRCETRGGGAFASWVRGLGAAA